MSKKRHAQQAAALPAEATSVPKAWIPAVALWIVALYVIVRSFGVHNYAQYAFWVQNDALNALSKGYLILAFLIAIVPPLRRAIFQHLEGLGNANFRRHALWLFVAFAGFFAWSWFIRYCQYRAYLLPTDTSQMIASGYTFLHEGRLLYPLWDLHPISEHFYWVVPMLSPALWLWGHPLAFLLAHHLLVASTPFAAYALAFRMTRSSFSSALLMILALASPYFYELMTGSPTDAIVPAFFLWGAYFAYARHWVMAAICFVLMTGCIEQVPFIYLGFGIYAAYAFRDKKPWNWAIAVGLCLAALLLFKAEMSVVMHFQRQEEIPGTFKMAVNKWGMFWHLVPSGTPKEAILNEIMGHPARTFSNFFTSIYRFYPLMRVLFSMGFLCLFAPFQMIPFAVSFLPHLLATPPEPVPFLDAHPITFFDLGLYHSACIAGPLLWATAHGIVQARKWLAMKRGDGWLLVLVLLFASFGYKHAHRTLNPYWRTHWFDAMPRVAARIPPDASLWSDEYAMTPISYRRWVKNIMWGGSEPEGYWKLFKPDYALFDKAFVRAAKPPYRDKMLTFFGENGYRKIADDSDILLLKSPSPTAPAAPPPLERLPDPNPRVVQAYGAYLLNAPPD